MVSFLKGVISVGFMPHLGPSKEVLWVGCTAQQTAEVVFVDEMLRSTYN